MCDGKPDTQRGKAKLRGNVAAHSKVTGHSPVSCAKTDEAIDIPFCMKTQVGPRNRVLDGVQMPRARGNVRGLSGHSNALAFFAAPVDDALQQRDHSIVNSRRHYSVCQASANSTLKMQCMGSIAVRISLRRSYLA